jgi:hypothetical protein
MEPDSSSQSFFFDLFFRSRFIGKRPNPVKGLGVDILPPRHSEKAERIRVVFRFEDEMGDWHRH